MASLEAIYDARTDSETPRARGRSYRPDIDGLRAIAIVSVVLYHAGVPLVSGGFAGVDVFFAISGYLIGGRIFSQLRDGAFSYLRFYQHRAKRILPAYFVVIAFALLAALVLLSPFEAWQLGREAFAATISVSNLLLARFSGYFDASEELNPLLMTWSLGVEEQFYLVVPLLMVLIDRFRRNWLFPAIAAICAVSLACAIWALPSHPEIVFYTLPARAWELGLGVLLAIAQQQRRLPPVRACAAELAGAAGIAMVLAPMFLLTHATPFPGASAVPPVVGTVILLAASDSWVNRKILSLGAATFLGRISYSLYLWHWPLLALARAVYGTRLPPTITAALLGLSLAVAVLSYRFIEQPFRRSERPPAPLLSRYAVAMALMLAACGALWLTHGLRARDPVLARMEDGGVALSADQCLSLFGKDSPNVSPSCFPASADRPGVAVWGDSHAAALAPGIRTAANDAGLRLAEFAKPSCPPLGGATRYLPKHLAAAAECMAFNRKVLNLIEADKSISVVVLAGFWAAPLQRNDEDGWLAVNLADQHRVPSAEQSRAEFAAALSATVRSLRQAGKKVVILGDVPNFDRDPIWMVTTGRIPARRFLYRLLTGHRLQDTGLASPSAMSSDPRTGLALLHEAVGGLPGVDILDLKSALCPSPNQCFYRDGNALLYIDTQHLSADGANFALARAKFSFPGGAQTRRE